MDMSTRQLTVISIIAILLVIMSLGCVSEISRTPGESSPVPAVTPQSSDDSIATLVAYDATREALRGTPLPPATPPVSFVRENVLETLEGITPDNVWAIGDEAISHVCDVAADKYAPEIILDDIVEDREVRVAIKAFCLIRGE